MHHSHLKGRSTAASHIPVPQNRSETAPHRAISDRPHIMPNGSISVGPRYVFGVVGREGVPRGSVGGGGPEESAAGGSDGPESAISPKIVTYCQRRSPAFPRCWREREARRQAHFITVFVRVLSGTVSIRVDPVASVERTKQLIHEQGGQPVCQMVLLHRTGWQLLHGKTLADYNIKHESRLELTYGGYKRPGYTNSGAMQPDLSQLPAS